MASERISRDEFAHGLDAELHRALDENLLDEDQLRALLAILEPAGERARLRKLHGGATEAQIESN